VTDFVETMRLVEKAQEDIYFAKLNRELIEELHRHAAAEEAAAAAAAAEKSAKARQAVGS
jgi:ribosomal protein L12E/L44/L45/RPP1/RPP2